MLNIHDASVLETTSNKRVQTSNSRVHDLRENSKHSGTLYSRLDRTQPTVELKNSKISRQLRRRSKGFIDHLADLVLVFASVTAITEYMI